MSPLGHVRCPMDERRGTSLSTRFGCLNAVKFLSTACTCSRSMNQATSCGSYQNLRYPVAALTTALSPYDPGKLSTLLVLNCKHLIPLAPSGQSGSDSSKATVSL